LAARDIELGGGALKVTGAKNTLFSASQEIRFTKNGSLDLAGDTSMQASRISAGAGVDATLRSPGVFSTMLPDAGAVTLAKDAELGARLSVLARAIDHRGNISLPGGALSLHAIGTSGTDSVTLAAGSRLDVSGRVVTFDDASVGAQGGTIELISDFSDVRVAPTAEVAVNAGSSGNAGSILLRALRGNVDVEGSLRGSASSADRGGEITVDAGRIARFGALNAMLEENGFTSARSFRQRGVGGLLLGVGQSLTAHRVSVTADQGALSILGSIDAHGPAGGLVSLNARNTITIAGTVDVSAHATGAAGGRIDLASTSGVYIAPGSLLNLSAGAPTGGTDAPRDGSLNIRLPRTAFSSLVDGTPGDEAITIAGRIEGAPRITLEGYKVYVDANGVLSAAEVEASDDNDMYREAGEFAANAAAIATALGRGDDEKFLVAPGIEIQSTGDLKLSADWNLSQWRFNDAPGVLTLRSGGSLLFDRSLSDGFAEVMGEEGFVLPETAGRSWSYRLAAGADRTSANALAVLDSTLLGTTRGDLKIAAGQVNNLMGGSRMIRTGTGTIDIATANDVVLGNRASVIYTAGAASSGFPLASDFGEIGYPTGGGDISIAANGNILGAQSNQLVTDWLWRTGRTEEQGEDIPVAWTVNFGRFAQGVGALGGGSVSVRAGGDIDNLSVSLPTIGRQVGGNTFAKSAVEVVGGGTLDVYAAGNIRGGSYYVGRGRGLLDAGGSIAPTSAAPNALAPILALGDAQFAVHARNGLALDGIVNPTLLPQGLSQGAASAQTYFATYTPQSSVSLTSTAGDLQFRDTPGAIQSTFTSMNFLGSGNSPLSMRIAAPTLRASSLSGDLQLAGAIGLFPSVSGTLDLLAEQDIRFANSLQITLSDADAAVLPSMANPQEGFGTLSLLVQPGSAAANFHADTPVHMPSKGGTIQPVRLVARTGDIVNEAVATGNSVSLYSAKPVRVSAGRDVRDLSMIVQNLLDSDITSIRAGRDIVYSTVRGTSGAVLETLGNIAIDGPGRLLLEAGRNVDLQASAGIATRGNLTNPALPANGASISVLAGTGASPPAYAAFVDRYLVSPTLYGADLIAFVEQQTGEKLDHARALARFRSFDVPRQRALLERVLLAELRTSGREAARSSSQDFTRAFAALETLYPGSNPDTDAGETNRYTGDIRLYFSRVYTLAGGDIDLLAPGGEINVGLATPPVAFGIQKPASSLGIVAQGTGSVSALAYKDFQVNESRVFAADGGNILVWSTRGDIDAGRGAKTAISAPPPTIIVDPRTGRVTVSRPSALTGSGIQTLATSLGRKPGDVDLFAPRGVVNAGDAGIVAGNLTIAATAVLGANNISVSGTAVGLPVDTGGLGASLAGASSSASGASKAAESDLEGGRGAAKSDTPVADAVLGWLEVFVEGFGADVCKPNDAACLNRENQKTGQ
jgi:hypothetical protein